ncbi:hypothetical protein ACWDOR_25935 [Streptosporangium canum]|uniref:hypothetical protein n=1 Tax=Streptosporangium canum TaxID=324952 RepID=UPI0036922B12
MKILSTLLKPDAGPAGVNGFDVATQAADVRESISRTGQTHVEAMGRDRRRR